MKHNQLFRITLQTPATGIFNRTFFLFLLTLAALSIGAAQTSQIAGVIRDADSEEPIPGVTIILEGTGKATSSDIEGKFLIPGLYDTTYRLMVSSVGYEEYQTEVTLSVGEILSLTILLEQSHVETEEVVITATRTTRSIADVPVRVEAIPQEEVEEKLLMTPSNVAMLLNESTGMRVQTTSSSSNAMNLRIQGLAGRYTQLLTDGVPNFGGLSASFSLTQIPPLNLRQVEVVKGAASSLYGTDAISGLVNFITKEPKPEGELQALINTTTQKGVDVAAYYSKQYEDFGSTLLVSRNTQQLYDVDGDHYADIAEFERLSVIPKLTFTLEEKFHGVFSFGYTQEDRTGGVTGITQPTSGPPLFRETIETDRKDVSANLAYDISENKSLALKFAAAHLQRDASYSGAPFNATQSLFYSELQYTVTQQQHTLLLGLAFNADDFTDNTSSHSGFLTYSYSSFGVFAQDEIKLSQKTSVLFSGRIDNHNDLGMFVLPRLAFMVRPNAELTLRLGIGTGFKAPTIFVEEIEDVRYQNVRKPAGMIAERSQSLSLDANWQTLLGEVAITANGALYLTNIDDALIADDDSLMQGILVLHNADDRLLSRGGELSVKLAYDDFKVSLGYTYTYATQNDRFQITEVALNPRHSFGAILFYENHEQQLKAGIENYWTGYQRLERNPWRAYSPGYWITGVIAEKGFGIIRVFVNFENIFDTRQTRFEPIIDGNVSSNFRPLPIYAPLEGRVINGGIRIVM